MNSWRFKNFGGHILPMRSILKKLPVGAHGLKKYSDQNTSSVFLFFLRSIILLRIISSIEYTSGKIVLYRQESFIIFTSIKDFILGCPFFLPDLKYNGLPKLSVRGFLILLHLTSLIGGIS